MTRCPLCETDHAPETPCSPYNLAATRATLPPATGKVWDHIVKFFAERYRPND